MIYSPIHENTGRYGNVLHTTVDREDVLKSGPIRCAAMDRFGKYAATAGEDKILKIWEIDGLKLLNERYVPFSVAFDFILRKDHCIPGSFRKDRPQFNLQQTAR